jgi:hypothetical protein
MRLAVLLLCAALAHTSDSPAITTFKAAMQGEDGIAKRDAINALKAKDAGSDEEVIPLLVGAISDRQGKEPAISALRARSGLTPPFPDGKTVAEWQTWLTAYTQALATKKQLDKIDKKLDAVVAAAKPAEEPPVESAPVAPPPRIPTDDLGKLDRIIYKSGRTLIAFVRSKRLDGDGNLVSVRVVHRDGAGEEVIDAAVIARIEEDIE